MTETETNNFSGLDYAGLAVSTVMAGVYGMVSAGVRASTPGRSAQAFLATYEFARTATVSFAFGSSEEVDARTVESAIIAGGSVAAGAAAGVVLAFAGVSATAFLAPAIAIGGTSRWSAKR
jgi:hypothetical protein